MLRSVLVVGATVCDMTLALHQAVSPVAAWAAAASLVLAIGGCLLTAAAISRKVAGLELPAESRR